LDASSQFRVEGNPSLDVVRSVLIICLDGGRQGGGKEEAPRYHTSGKSVGVYETRLLLISGRRYRLIILCFNVLAKVQGDDSCIANR